jgi:anti-sigma B factor antagonist
VPAPTRPQGPYPQLSYHDQVGVTVILLHGDLDILSVPALEAYLNDIRSRGRLRSVADLTALTFIDCACLTVLVRYCQEVRARGGSFALAGAHDTVYRVLSVTGLLTWFDIYDTVAAAIAAAVGC